jgi:phosphoglycolate phosphatase
MVGPAARSAARRAGAMRYRLVIFDFDGTLADSFPLFLRTLNAVADELDFKRIDEGEIESLRGFGPRALMKHLGVPGWKVPLIAGRMRSRMTREIAHVALFDGVSAVLGRLSEAGVRLAVVTSNTEENVRRVLGPRNAALIGYYECGTPLFGKTARLRRVLRRSGVEAHEAICIGDEIRDIDAARGARIPFGGVAWGFATVEALCAHAPAELFHTVEEIADRIV